MPHRECRRRSATLSIIFCPEERRVAMRIREYINRLKH
jgi:hypothetical protein